MSSYATASQSLAIRPVAEQVVPTVNLGALIMRIEEAVTEETQSIRTDIRFDIKASNARKSRYLYELNRALKGTREGSVPAEHRDGLIRLREDAADRLQKAQAQQTQLAAMLEQAMATNQDDLAVERPVRAAVVQRAGDRGELRVVLA